MSNKPTFDPQTGEPMAMAWWCCPALEVRGAPVVRSERG
jgi:hypothetical protein